MEKFFGAVQNMFKIPELRRRILFTLGLLAVYRFGAHVQAPGINKVRLEQVWGEVAGTLLAAPTPPGGILEKYGPIFKLRVMGYNVIALAGPDANKLILHDDQENFLSKKGWGFIIGDLFINLVSFLI